MTTDPVKRFLEPIPGAHATGEDLSFDPVLDEIKEARRADDPTLAQGDWVTELKSSDWGKVSSLCEDLLTKRTKDLQLVGWYIEAIANKQGFAGLAAGLQILEGLLTVYWEGLYPPLEDGIELRIGRFEWMDTFLGNAARALPMFPASAGGYSWLKWQESRDVENLGLKNPDLKATAIHEGKLSGEAFDKAVRSAGGAWFKQLHRDLSAALEAFNSIAALLDHYLAGDSPTLDNLRKALEGCELLARNLRGKFEASPPPEPASGAVPAEQDFHAAPSASLDATKGFAMPSLPTSPDAVAGRAQAIYHLRQVAAYFRTHEPHSPVAPLVERAARWAEMNLESWLSEVVRDDAVLHQLKTLLDFREESS